MIDFLKGTVGKDYFSSAWVGWELESNGRLKELPSPPWYQSAIVLLAFQLDDAILN